MSQYPNEDADKFHRQMMNKMGGKGMGGSMVRAANRYMLSAEEKKSRMSNTS